MEIEEVFKSPFKLVFSCPPYFSPVSLPGLKFFYRTEEIASPTNTNEIFEKSQMYLKQTIEKYNCYQTEGGRLVKTNHRLYIAWEVEKDGLKQLKEKDLYETTYNIEEGKKEKIEEKIFYYLYPETIERNFFIYLVSTVYFFREEQPNPEELEELEEVEEYKTIQTIKSPECVICYHNQPNMLYFGCRHIAVCDSCDLSGKLLKCPLCRTKIKNQRIKI